MTITCSDGPLHVVFSSPLLPPPSKDQIPSSTPCLQSLSEIIIPLTFRQACGINRNSVSYVYKCAVDSRQLCNLYLCYSLVHES
jgi:hypothetical protein